MIWREKRLLLIILGLLLLANTIFFLTYRVQYQSRLDGLDQRLHDVEQGLQHARAARLQAEHTYDGYRQVGRDVMQVFNEQWSTEPKRFTAMVVEVKRLAAASNLSPATYGYARLQTQKISTGDRRSLGASEVGIDFGVQGTYAQIRRLINLLELSHQFVIIDSIGLTSADADLLTLNLHLKTIFRDEPDDVAKNRS